MDMKGLFSKMCACLLMSHDNIEHMHIFGVGTFMRPPRAPVLYFIEPSIFTVSLRVINSGFLLLNWPS